MHGRYPCLEANVDVQQIILAIVFPVMLICLFSFASVAMWSNARRKEREAFYRSETMKKVAESGAGGTAVLDMLREQERTSRVRRREGYKLAGLVAVASGVGMMAFLSVIERTQPVFMAGLIPMFVGVAMLAYVFLMVPRD